MSLAVTMAAKYRCKQPRRWLVLAAYHIPETGALPAALARHGRRLLAFFAKLTGVIIIA
jgi:hypothetical protein